MLVRPAQRGTVLGEHLPHLLGPPGGVARLHRDLDARGPPGAVRRVRPGAAVAAERRQAGRQPLGVGGQVRRELQQHRPQPAAEPAGRGHQLGHRFLRVPQAPDVGEVTARLDRHNEIGGDSRLPAGERVAGGEPVEGAVVLDRRVLAGVIRQPVVLRQVRRVQGAAPVAVLPAGGAHDDGHGYGTPRGSMPAHVPAPGPVYPGAGLRAPGGAPRVSRPGAGRAAPSGARRSRGRPAPCRRRSWHPGPRPPGSWRPCAPASGRRDRSG